MNWPMVPLGDVATVERRSISPDYIAGDAWYLGLEHIESGGRILGRQAAEDAGLKSSKFEFGPEHVLYGKLRPYLAKIATPDFSGVCSTDILPVRPGELLHRSYLTHYLRKGEIVDLANSRAAGANLPRLSPAELEKLPIPLPPLEEQRRIAAILDQADVIRAKRRMSATLSSELPLAVFRSLFDAKVPERRLGDVVRTSSGGTPSRSNSDYYNGLIPWVKSGEIHQGLITATSETITEEGLRCSAASVLPRGTVVMAMYGATAGIVGMLAMDAATNQAVCAFFPGDEVLSDYLLWALQSRYDQLLSRRSGGAQPNLSQLTVRDLTIPVPQLEEQRRFGDLAARFTEQSHRETKAFQRQDELFASLQARAFKGEL